MPTSQLASVFSEAGTRVRSAPDDLWPGFHPAGTPLLMFDGRETHLTGSSPCEPGWTEVAGGWRWPGRHPALVANTAVTLPGDVVAAGVLPDGLEALGTGRVAALLVHEAFHVFQAATPSAAWEANELDALTYPRTDPAVAHARAEESASLAAALARPVDGQELARTALAWRAVRFHHLSPQHILYERRMETLEGLAHFVETRFLNETPRLDAVRDARANVREWTYRSGAALAHLLTRGGGGWQAQAMAGIPLDDLLRAQVGAADFSEPTPELLEAAHRAAEAAHAHLSGLRTAFQNLPSPRLTLHAGTPWQVRGFDPLNIQVLPDGALLHARYLHLSGTEGEVEVLGASSLTRGPHPLSVLTLEVAGGSPGWAPVVRDGRWHLDGEPLRVSVPAQAVTPDGQGGWSIRF